MPGTGCEPFVSRRTIRLPFKLYMVLLITAAGELFRSAADEKKIDLAVNLPETMLFLGDIKKMQRIVTNLLENALKYTPEQGTGTVSGMIQGGQVRIAFKDTGMGISEKDLPHFCSHLSHNTLSSQLSSSDLTFPIHSER